MQYCILFSNVLLDKGISRCILIDLQYQRYKLIPLGLSKIILDLKNNPIIKVKEKYKFSLNVEIDNLIETLINEGWAFLTNNIKLFPPLSNEWDNPSIITNSIVDFDEQSKHKLCEIINDLDMLNCNHLQIRYFYNIDQSKFLKDLNCLKEKSFNFIEFILPYQEYFIENSFLLKINELFVIRNITLFNSPEDKLIIVEDKNTERISFSIRFDSESYSVKNCGLIEKEQFVVNENSYFESKNYNSCLNRKVCIDSNGEIKNCPSMVKSFGNIENLTIIDAINISGFKDLWVINKNHIEVCKDCEFRHICTDCRAYIEDPNNIYSKPAKCSYDPYTATWGKDNPTNNLLHGK